MLSKKNQKILHRRWLITAIIVAAIITFLHLWVLVFYFLIFLLILAAGAWFIDWVTGDDLYGHPEDNQPSNEEKTMWDIFTLNQLFNHHDDQ